MFMACGLKIFVWRGFPLDCFVLDFHLSAARLLLLRSPEVCELGARSTVYSILVVDFKEAKPSL